MDVGTELLQMFAEYEAVLALGRGPVIACGDEVPGICEVHPLGQRIQDLAGRRRSGPVVHDEHDVLAALQELFQRGPGHRPVEGPPQLSALVADLHVLRIYLTGEVLLWQIEELLIVLSVRDGQSHGLVRFGMMDPVF